MSKQFMFINIAVKFKFSNVSIPIGSYEVCVSWTKPTLSLVGVSWMFDGRGLSLSESSGSLWPFVPLKLPRDTLSLSGDL